MGPAKRFLCIGLGIALVEALIGIPLIGTILGSYFWVLAAVTAAMAIAFHRMLEPPDDDEGGGGPPRGGGPPGDDPPWWPGFERDFRRYVQERVRDRAPV